MHDRAFSPLAIIGMACRLPGADDLGAYWDMLCDGRTGLGELPPHRFNRRLYYNPEKGHRTKSYTSVGGILNDVASDRANSPLSESIIEHSHETHLGLFDVVLTAFHHAGLNPFDLATRNVGVYVGHTPPSAKSGNCLFARQIAQAAQLLREVNGFEKLSADQQESVIREIIDDVRSGFSPDDKQFNIWSSAYHAPALISRGLNLSGPAVAFDAACASSLRALGHAARALQLGEIEMAIVGGASICHSDSLVLFSQAQTVSATGSRPFDQDADGLVVSEGHVVILMKLLERAIADSDEVFAVIRSVGISSDGRGKSLWAPRKEGQIEAINRAYAPGIAMADVQFVEMHATSTQVGDATEIDALAEVFGREIPPGRKIPVGSAKANVGHTLESAGLASLIKTVLAIRNGVIPPQIGINKLNDTIAWEAIPFFVPQEPICWNPPAAGRPRRAAVSAFGIGGLNVHVVIDEFVSDKTDYYFLSPRCPVSAVNVKSHSKSAPSNEPIAIIGMGAIFPGARTINALFDVLRTGDGQIRYLPAEPWTRHVDAGSEMQWRFQVERAARISDFSYDWKKHRVPPKQLANADPLQFMLLDAADQAFQDAGLDQKPFNRTRTGTVVGTIFGGLFHDHLNLGLRLPEFQELLTRILKSRGLTDEVCEEVAREYEEVLLKHMPALIDETGSLTASTLASRITKTFDLMGGAVAVDAGNASSIAALSASIDLLRAGDCDMMLCAAGQLAMSCSAYASMAREGYLARHGVAAPFDADASGCVPGECVGVVLLKRLGDAQRDKDPIRGVIRGIGMARDVCLGDAIKNAIRSAHSAANVLPEEVALVEAAAIGAPALDDNEISAIADAYRQRARPVVLTAASSQFGYTGGGSGIASLFKTVAELNELAVPKIAPISKPVPALATCSNTIQLPTQKTVLSALNEDGRVIAGVDSYSQYNLAYHVILEGATRDEKHVRNCASSNSASLPQRDSWRIVRLAGSSFAELQTRLAEVRSLIPRLFERANLHEFGPADRNRLTIVAASCEDLNEKLQLAVSSLTQEKHHSLLAERGIFYQELGHRPARVACLFSGPESLESDTLQSLIRECPDATRELRNVNSVFEGFGLPSFEQLAWTSGDHQVPHHLRTQLSLLAANMIVYGTAVAVGLHADRIAGHGLGELSGLVAAGALPFDRAVRGAIACFGVLDGANSRADMVSTNAPAAVVEVLCGEVAGAYVSQCNSPSHTIVACAKGSAVGLSELLQARGYAAQQLCGCAGIHTPLMTPVAIGYSSALAGLAVDPPTSPFLSGVTRHYIAEPTEIRAQLLAQLTTSVDYSALIMQLATEGIGLFLEVGPGQVLTKYHREILAEWPVHILACDQEREPGMPRLLYVRGCLDAMGLLDRDKTFAGRIRINGVSLPLKHKPPGAKGRHQSHSTTATNTSKVANGCLIESAHFEENHKPRAPLVHKALVLEPSRRFVAQFELDPTNDIFLTQHLYKRRPMMPVVAGLEILAQASTQLMGPRDRIAGIRNVRILSGMRFLTDEPKTARIFAEKNNDGIACRFTCDFRNRRGDLLRKDKPYLDCVVETVDTPCTLKSPLPRQPDQWVMCHYPDQKTGFWHGPTYRCLNDVAVEATEGWGRLIAPRTNLLFDGQDRESGILDAVPLDACFYVCGVTLWWQLRYMAAIPDAIDRLLIGRRARPNERCLIHVQMRDRQEQRARFDFSLFGDDGAVIISAEGYRNIIVTGQKTAVFGNSSERESHVLA